MDRLGSYKVSENWEKLPLGFTHLDCVGVSTDNEDNVYLLTRSQPRLIVYTRDGAYLRSWGEDLFTNRTHGVTIATDGSVYCVDEGAHCVYRFTPVGEMIGIIGVAGIPSATGYDGALESVTGGPPFNRPTNLAISPTGELYVSDGYGNCKIHRFSSAGELIQSWGRPGTGHGEFNLPHGVAVDKSGKVLVADRENDRIQVFSPEGAFITEWTDVQRPTNIAVDSEGRIIVSELSWRAGERSYVHGAILEDRPGGVSFYDGDGELLTRWGRLSGSVAGTFTAPHDVAVDSVGDVYVAEVTHSFTSAHGGSWAPDQDIFRKFSVQRTHDRSIL